MLAVANKCLVHFSRGSSSCIGQNLAMCELYVTLGTLFRRFGELAARDVGELAYVDYFNPSTRTLNRSSACLQRSPHAETSRFW